jgi:hypothetical protein
MQSYSPPAIERSLRYAVDGAIIATPFGRRLAHKLFRQFKQ